MVTPDKANILLVDDQPAKLLSYEAMLGELGETLITARSAREALDLLLRTDVAVVLVDVCMPELDGFELASLMRDHPRFQRTPIIFVSGVHLTDFDRIKGYACGAVDYIPVPVVPEILRAKVSIFADLYRKTLESERLRADLERRVAERTAELEALAEGLRDRERELREADQRKDEFLATLAHEIRNPLAPILTSVQLMRLPELPEKQRSVARDIIERQVGHLVRLVDDLMDVSRITRGVITLQRDRLDIAEVIARAVETSRPLLDARSHKLHVSLPEESLFVEGDLTRLSQVVANLLNNSAKYTDDHGHVELTVTAQGDDVVIRVKDSGVGIRPEALPKVFELFTQIEARANQAGGGLGIGLALVRRLVEMHGGRVTAHSDGVGRGAELVVTLPLAADRRGMSVATPEPVAIVTKEPRRVLVVDDNREAADSMALLVSIAGHEVRTAYDGDTALSTAADFAPDLLLLDLGMPGLTGYEIARHIRHQPWGKDIALVAVTGWGQERDRRRTADAGFDAHLVKPVGSSELLHALDVRRARAQTAQTAN
jgi:signal transduction histidine kinase